MIQGIIQTIRRFDLMKYLIKSDLKIRYKNRVLGFFWAVLDPLMMMGVYVFLISFILQKAEDNYPVLLFSALLSYRWMSFSTGNNVLIFVKNSSLIQSVKFPLSVLILNEVNIGLFNYFMGLIILFPMLFLFNVPLSWYLLLYPILIFFQYLMISGLGMMVSVIGVFFLDLQNIILILLRVILYLSPVLWQIDKVPTKYYTLYLLLNPFGAMVQCYKDITVNARLDIFLFLIFVIYSIIFFIIGYYFYNRNRYLITKNL